MMYSDLTNTAQAVEAMRDSLDLTLKTKLSKGLSNLLQIRTILEPGIAAIAAEMATTEDIETIQEAIAALAAVGDNANGFVKADQEFHLALAKATQNSFVPVLLNSIMELLKEQEGCQVPLNGGILREQADHQRILETIRQRDPEAARQTMIDHLQQLLEDGKTVVS